MNQIDLGTTPPLDIEKWKKAPPDKKEVSLSWMLANVLAGATFLGLIGGALYVAFDGRERIALPPASIDEDDLRGRTGDLQVRVRKEARKTDDSPHENNRNVINVSVVTRANGKNIVHKKPFAFVNASLAHNPGTSLKQYPPFNPLNIFAESRDAKQFNITATENQTIYGTEVDGDVALNFRRFPDNFVLEKKP